MRSLVTTVFVGAALMGLAACGGDGDHDGGKTTRDGDEDAGKPAYVAADHTGSLSGTVKLSGPRPEPKLLVITGDNVCTGSWKNGHVDERHEVAEDGGLPHVIVWARKGPHGDMRFATSDSPNGGKLKITQKGCIYTPHVFGVMVGEKFVVVNDDQTTHNVHVKPRRNPEANKSQVAGKVDTFAFEEKEMAISFVCDIHSWMQSWAFVLEHPFFVTTDARGAFKISGLPDGDYEFVAWHERFGETTFKVSVKDGRTEPVAVALGD